LAQLYELAALFNKGNKRKRKQSPKYNVEEIQFHSIGMLANTLNLNTFICHLKTADDNLEPSKG